MPLDLPPAPPAEIVVTGGGLVPVAGEAGFGAVTIDRGRLTATASGRLEDALRDVAGLQQFRRSDARSAHPTSQGVTLRGLGGNAASRALVTLDGVPQADPFGGWVGFAAFDPARLESVRVTRGGGSGANGPGALAGTIELQSAGPTALAPVFGGLAYGSRDAIDADAGASIVRSRGFASLAASYQRGDGFVPIVRGRRGPADRGARYEQGSVAARAIVPVGAAVEGQANLGLFSDARDRGLAFTDSRTTGADASLRLVGQGRWGWEALAYGQLRKFRSRFASVDAARTAAGATLDQYNTPATGIGGKLELRPPVGPGVALALGVDARRTAGETLERFSFVAGAPTRLREAGGRTTVAGAFADLSVTAVARLTLDASARIDRWRISDGRLRERAIATGASVNDLAFADRTGTRETLRGGLSYKLGGGLSARIAGYRAWRLPTLNELYRPFRAGADATAANPLLAPERLTGADLGLAWRPLPTVRLAATAFRNRLEDAIGNVTLGRGPGTFPVVGVVGAGGSYRERRNLDAIRSRGVELEAAFDTGTWSLAASYAHVDARVRASGAAAGLDRLRPAQTPRHQASATLGYSAIGGARLSVTARYVASQYEDDQNSRRLKGATTFDAVAAVPLAPSLMLEGRVENAGDARVEATVAADGVIERAAPRTFWIGLRYGDR